MNGGLICLLLGFFAALLGHDATTICVWFAAGIVCAEVKNSK